MLDYDTIYLVVDKALYEITRETTDDEDEVLDRYFIDKNFELIGLPTFNIGNNTYRLESEASRINLSIAHFISEQSNKKKSNKRKSRIVLDWRSLKTFPKSQYAANEITRFIQEKIVSEILDV